MTNRKMCASYSLATGAALALFVASAPADAKEVTVLGQIPADQLTERVSYADLDLATSYGVEKLTFRVRGAVNRVCAPLDQRATFSEHGECRSYAWSGARPQMQQAVARAQQIASTGTSAIAPVAILIAVPQH